MNYFDKCSLLLLLLQPRSNKFRCNVVSAHARTHSQWYFCIGRIHFGQCDQMSILFFKYLPMCHNENVPKSIEKIQIGINSLPNNKLTLKQLPKTLKMLTTWWNFAKSGHTDFGEKNTLSLIKRWRESGR